METNLFNFCSQNTLTQTQTQPHTTAQPTPVRHSLARAVARAVKRQTQVTQVVQSVYDDEDYLFALIAGKDYNNDNKCKTKLEKYCKEFENLNINKEKIHKKLNDFCERNKAQEKCQKLKSKIENKRNTFKSKLEKVVQKEVSNLESSDCVNEQECLFLEEAFPNDLKDNCNTLRNKCYQKKRDKVAEETLLRALKGNLQDKNKCRKEIENVCRTLGQENNELMQRCLNLESTCLSLVQAAEEKCNSLKTEIKNVLEPSGDLEKRGHSLLEKCYFYGKNCKDSNKPECEKLINKTKKKKIIYKGPGSDFDPTKPEATLAEKIGLEELYKEAATQGVLIGRAPERDALDLLVFLSEKTSFSEDQCKKVLATKCGSFKHLEEGLKTLCDNETQHENKCKVFEKEFKEIKAALTAKFKKFGDEIELWNKLPSFLTEDECVELESDCFYFENQSFEKQCKNVKAACYKKGLYALANQELQDKLRGKFHGTNDTSFEKLQKELVKVCADLKKKSNELYMFCVQPDSTISILLGDLHFKVDLLQEHLNARRDLPTERDCRILLKKCKDLVQDSEEIEWPCHTLKQNCDRLRVVEQLEEKFLEEKTKKLDDSDSCIGKIDQQCREWNRKGRAQFALACVAQNTTCKILTESVDSKCTTLKARMETSKVVEAAKEKNTMEETCDSWEPYCRKFMSSCQNLTTVGGGKCDELNKECEPYRIQRNREDQAMLELKGKLDNKNNCVATLNQYCTQWVNATNGLETLCKKKDEKDEDVRNKLCKKLIERIKEKCKGLSEKLEKVKNEIKEKNKEYEGIKKKAEDAMEKANLVLSKVKESHNKSVNKSVPSEPKGEENKVGFKLVRRDTKLQVTEKELHAFDLVSQAFSLYVELKEICHHSLKDCDFKKECNCEDPCKKIQEVCSKLEPLKVKPYETTIK
ncbi:uncharacterized protein T551_03682, partial [Pneumocystis jirovecii RU7]